MKELLFFPEEPSYRGNLHSHTNLSDGTLSPQEAKDHYKGAGYDFLCLTDHDLYTDFSKTLNDESFLILPGVERSAILLEKKEMPYRPIKVHHMLGILGTKEMQQQAKKPVYAHLEEIPVPVFFKSWEGERVAQEMVDQLVCRGFFVNYNHPLWSRVEPCEYEKLNNLWGLEILNYGTENECGLGKNVSEWDAMLTRGTKVFGIATDDNHNNGVYHDAFGGYVMVFAKELSHDAIVGSLLQGRFYASSGLSIVQWGMKENKVFVSCPDATKIQFICGGAVGNGITLMSKEKDVPLSYGEYTLQGNETYVRVECENALGQWAWTNPYFF